MAEYAFPGEHKGVARLLQKQAVLCRPGATQGVTRPRKRRKRQSCFDDFAPLHTQALAKGERTGITLYGKSKSKATPGRSVQFTAISKHSNRQRFVRRLTSRSPLASCAFTDPLDWLYLPKKHLFNAGEAGLLAPRDASWRYIYIPSIVKPRVLVIITELE